MYHDNAKLCPCCEDMYVDAWQFCPLCKWQDDALEADGWSSANKKYLSVEKLAFAERVRNRSSRSAPLPGDATEGRRL